MSFSCYIHGWHHGQSACPVCFPLKINTSTSIELITPKTENINQIKKLEEEIDRLKKLLEDFK